MYVWFQSIYYIIGSSLIGASMHRMFDLIVFLLCFMCSSKFWKTFQLQIPTLHHLEILEKEGGIMLDETGPRGRWFHTVSCQKYFRTYQFDDLIEN